MALLVDAVAQHTGQTQTREQGQAPEPLEGPNGLSRLACFRGRIGVGSTEGLSGESAGPQWLRGAEDLGPRGGQRPARQRRQLHCRRMFVV